MAKFLFLPGSKQVINLHQISGLSLDMDHPGDEEFTLQVHLAAEGEALIYETTDAQLILTNVAKEMGLPGAELIEKLRLTEDDFEDE